MASGLSKGQGRQQSKNKNYYKVQPGLTDRNKKRKLRRHIRANPGDFQATKRYEKDMGKVDSLGLSAKGRRVTRRLKKALARDLGLVKASQGPEVAG